MTDVLLATASDKVFDDISSAMAGEGTIVSRVAGGRDVRGVMSQVGPDLTILDAQMGSMGGMAVCRDLRLEAEMGRVPDTRILLLLDRDVDVWLARESGADGWMIKPVDSLRLRRAADALAAGETWHEGVEAEVVDDAEAGVFATVVRSAH